MNIIFFLIVFFLAINILLEITVKLCFYYILFKNNSDTQVIEILQIKTKIWQNNF